MKKVQKFLAVLLCVCALMGVMMPAASAATVLTVINLTLDAPKVGQKPTTTASVPSHARSSVKKVEWSGRLDSNGAFMAGVSYKVTVTLGIKSGEDCVFSSKSITAKVNTKAADEVFWYARDKVEVVYTFPKLSESTAPTALNKVRLTVDAPEVGRTPAQTASLPSTARSAVQKVEWSGKLDGSGAFMSGTRYKVTVTLGIKPGSNAIFSDKSINATVNGKTADEVLWYADDKVEVIYTFPRLTGSAAPTVLKEAHITLTAPETGKIPAASAEIPSGLDYTVKKVEWEGALEGGRFKAGTSYTAKVTLGIAGGKNAVFSDEAFDAYVNDYLIDNIVWYSGSEIVVPVVFEKTPDNPPEPTVTPDPPTTGFSDVKAGDYFAQPVAWAVNNKITSGTGGGKFSPGQKCTQAQILTFLWRATGSPEPAGTIAAEGFTGTEYYYKAVLWAAERGMIATGNFDPNAPCTRAAAVTFMWNYAGSPSVPSASFTDVPADAEYAQAVAWAVKEGVTTGIGGNQFGPDQTCSRGQIVSFLYRAFAR